MPGFLLDANATVMCMHGGTARPTSPFPRVRAGGAPVTVQPVPWVVAGCTLVPPPVPPCVTATFVTAAVRVRAGGMPVLLQDSQAVCVPTGTGLNVVLTQTRVRGT
jgi:hypothetical protein